jgi:hypothetical protein
MTSISTLEQLNATRFWLRKMPSWKIERVEFAGPLAYWAMLIATRILIQREDGWEWEPWR